MESMSSSLTRVTEPLTRQATRADPRTGIHVEAELFGDPGSRLFGILHRPRERAVAGLVVCPALGVEFLRNYRNELLLAESLAARGIAVQRFHYRGSGNSQGDERAATFEGMCQDALAAAEWMKARSGLSAVAFLGTRWGGLVAASAAQRFPNAPLILWEPVSDPDRYFREARRWRVTLDLTEGPADTPGRSLLSELEESGSIDVIGYSIHRDFYESAVNRSLTQELGSAGRPLLLVQVSRRTAMRNEYASLTSGLGELGWQVDTAVVMSREAWWSPVIEEEDAALPGMDDMVQLDAIGLTADWVSRRFPSGEPR